MYLRHSVRRKDGKRLVYWRLVRSVRLNGKVVQETVAQLGDLSGERLRLSATPRFALCLHHAPDHAMTRPSKPTGNSPA